MRGTWFAPAAHWTLFVVGLGVVPVVFAWVLSFAQDAPPADQAVPVTPLARGDLFLLAATVAFTGIGAVVARFPARHLAWAVTLIGVLVLNGLFAALMFAGVSSAVHPHEAFVAWLSGLQSGLSAVAGGGCAVLAGLAEGTVA